MQTERQKKPKQKNNQKPHLKKPNVNPDTTATGHIQLYRANPAATWLRDQTRHAATASAAG
jgi:hypothetical protein